MKHAVSEKNFHHWAPAVLRHLAVAELSHDGCPVRQCRRNGWCTGPLVLDGPDSAGLAPPDRKDIRAGEALVPVCFYSLPEESQRRVSELYVANLEALRADPDACVVEPARTIRARGWKKIR
jgi:hypothetical protein